MAARGGSRGLSWSVATLCCALVLAAGLAAGCGSGGGDAGSSRGSTSLPAASPSSGSSAADDLVDVSSGGGSAAARAEIERRLSVPRFTYVAENDISQAKRTGALAIIDSKKDKLAHRPQMGKVPNEVAVAPDGRLVYVTDFTQPVVHVLDAETFNEVRTIRLPGVKAGQRITATGAMCYADMQGCSSSIACTPGGDLVLVLTKAGLQVIDTATFEVVRTMPELKDGSDIAVSFDGSRGYIATLDYLKRGSKTLFEWSKLTVGGTGGGLALLDLKSWEVVRRVKCGLIGDIAVDPDDTRFFVSDNRLQSLRIVDPATLEDLSVIDLTSARSRDFQPRGVGVLPDGSKIYVVCADTSMNSATAQGPSADEYFCAVVDAAAEEVVKRIPLDAY